MKRVLLIILSLALIGGAIAIYFFNKKTKLKAEGEPTFNMSSKEICDAFLKDSAGAIKKFVGDKITMSFDGIVDEVSLSDSLASINLKGADDSYSVSCGFNDKEVIKNLQAVNKNDKITVQCYCSGLKNDGGMLGATLDMNRCNLLKHTKIEPILEKDTTNGK